MTIRDIGLTAKLKAGDYEIYDRDDVNTLEDKIRMYRKAFECDYYLSSVNAISEDGVIVNIDGNGNRVAAITWGPEHVILVVGLNKVCQDVDAAIKRARSEAAPINMAHSRRIRTSTGPTASTDRSGISAIAAVNILSLLQNAGFGIGYR